MPEEYGFAIVAFAGLLVLVGYVWLVILGFRHSFGWGLLVLIFPPAGFGLLGKGKRLAYVPLGLILGGLLLAPVPYIINRNVVKLEPYEQIVDDERHVTLTGWGEGKDYALLNQKQDTVVLQMANADVTDQTLLLLKDFKKLRELDLSDTQVTDAGLAILKDLPQLRVLRLARTKITKAGFEEHIMPLKELQKIDVRETAIPAKPLRDWKNENPKEREYLK